MFLPLGLSISVLMSMVLMCFWKGHKHHKSIHFGQIYVCFFSRTEHSEVCRVVLKYFGMDTKTTKVYTLDRYDIILCMFLPLGLSVTKCNVFSLNFSFWKRTQRPQNNVDSLDRYNVCT